MLRKSVFPDLSAQHRRKHRLPQHDQPQAAGVEEKVKDGGRAIGRRTAAGRREYPCRPIRLCRMAERQQGLLPANGRPYVRRRAAAPGTSRSEENTSELQSLMRISYAVFWLNNK